MSIQFTGVAKIKHCITGDIYEFYSEDLDWNCVSSDKESMGSRSFHEAIISDEYIGEIIWRLWEYPEGIEEYREVNVGPHILIEDFHGGIETEPDSEYWDIFDPPDHPYFVFRDSMLSLKDFMASQYLKDGSSLVNRMIFMQQMSIFEAYLSDVMISKTLENAEVLKAFVSGNDDLRAKKFTAQEIMADDDIIKTHVKLYLSKVSFHNIARVDNLFNIAFGFKISAFSDDSRFLFKSIRYRHDCVHRNGFDEEGNKLAIFDGKYLDDISIMISKIAGAVELEMGNLLAKRYFESRK